jgi:hypothetical protein
LVECYFNSIAVVAPRHQAVETLRWSGVVKDQIGELYGHFDEAVANEPSAAARSIWDGMCDAAPMLSVQARLALRWLALETYHHNFGMAMASVVPAGGVGVVTRCSDIYSFVHEEPVAADAEGVSFHDLPVPVLSETARRALESGPLLVDVVTPGTRLNRAKVSYLVAVSQAVADGGKLEMATNAANEYSRLLSEHFARGASSRTGVILQVVTAAFGAAAGAAIGLVTAPGPGVAAGAVVGGVAAQGAVAGLVCVIDKFAPVLMQTFRAETNHVALRSPRGGDLAASLSIVTGQAFASVTMGADKVADHVQALPRWSTATY